MDDNKKVQQLTLILMALLFVLLALGIAGNGDIEAEQDSARLYTEMFARVAGPTMRTASQPANNHFLNIRSHPSA
jgi:sulfite exporter TauE/SafE